MDHARLVGAAHRHRQRDHAVFGDGVRVVGDHFSRRLVREPAGHREAAVFRHSRVFRFKADLIHNVFLFDGVRHISRRYGDDVFVRRDDLRLHRLRLRRRDRRVVGGALPHRYGALRFGSAAVVRRGGDRRFARRFRRYRAVRRDFGDVPVARRPGDVFGVGTVRRDRSRKHGVSADGERERRLVQRHALRFDLFKERRYLPLAAPGHIR